MSKETIRVLWDPPLEPNGDIRAYRLHYSKAVKDPRAINSDKVSIVRLAGNTTSKYLPDLESLTEYYFWVIASTSKGFGNASAVVTQTTKEQSKLIVHWFKDTSGDCVCPENKGLCNSVISWFSFWQPISRAFFESRISPRVCFKILNPDSK